MKFPISWLKEFVDIPTDIELLSERLSFAGLEVDAIEPIGEKLSGIITGKIEDIKPHPDADRLVITQINLGNQTSQIVTGANNISIGDIVPVSPPGAVLSNGTKIKSSKLRGIPSHGMLCSEAELGVTEDAEGIWILPADTPIGIDFIEYAQLKDTLLDIAILPNRGDCQSIYGIARECATLFDTSIREPETKVTLSDLPTVSLKRESNYCGKYTLRNISNCQLNETPIWMKRRLELCGIRPIQLFVDITNYVLLELGQPLHAFDAKKVNGAISVSDLNSAIQFKTLDEQDVNLEVGDIVIQDNSGTIALAGVMGGYSTEVSDKTSNIILESAFFDPIKVRKTGTRLGLRTESSLRFEKTVDIEACEKASDRAAFLFQTLANASIGQINVELDNQHNLLQKKALPFDVKRINSLLGTSLSENEIKNALEKCEFEILNNQIFVPSFRKHDIHELPCIAEEVARIIGIDQLPTELPPGASISNVQLESYLFQSDLCKQFCSLGFQETNTFPMISKNTFEAVGFNLEGTIELSNPISQDESVMRSYVFLSLIERAAFNIRHQQKEYFFFEVGKAFHDNYKTHFEEQKLCVLANGIYYPNPINDNNSQENLFDIFQLKGVLKTVFKKNGLQFKISREQSFFHPKKQCVILNSKGESIGFLGQVHPETSAKCNILESTVIAELNLNKLETKTAPTQFKPITKFPVVKRDMALVCDKTLPYEDIEAFLSKYKPKLVSQFQLFDIFESDQLGDNKKSMAISFTYEKQDASLTDEEVNKAHEKLSKFITKELPVTIR